MHQDIYTFLQQYQIMAIATYGDEPWIANIYYGVTPSLELYFFSNPQSIHGQHIAKNPQVACAIYDSTQTPIQQQSFVRRAVQLSGMAKLLTADDEITEALTVWRQALRVTADVYSLEGLQQNKVEGRMYRVIPSKVRMFDESRFNDKNIPLLTL